MEILVVADSHIIRTPDGNYWTKTIYGYNFWTRYLSVFQKVKIVSRTMHIDSIDTNSYLKVNGDNVDVVELPYLRGTKDYLKSFFKLKNAAKRSVDNAQVAIFRLPSIVASVVLDEYKKTGKPYSIEVVADPHDAYSNNKLAQWYFTRKMKKDILSANGVSYVTSRYLQNIYPSKAKIAGENKYNFESYYSTIDLKEDFFYKERMYKNIGNSITIVHTANSINNDNKGHSIVIDVVKNLREKNIDANVIFIGDGTKRVEFEKLSKKYGIDKYVSFTGLLPDSNEVREILLKGDIFIFPTKAEGLPRAIIEAMAVGLPCLSTPISGIPELIESKYLFEPEDVNGFTDKVIKLINSPKELEEMSSKNIETAKGYTYEKLQMRRDCFYKKLLDIS
ncbi:hypothetical protein BW721_05885 [Jeotgalibaca sp. PTS2502]|uniref:glycosyltransferase family 4 protein n=1 Tax=Jeotgalibaca sp. PTS2502 TaxID=1903686 RepID=UPI000973617E|nr:glycosyltransferase [Jeotgalibaca sp. PTS2502]APZ49244.1 hypothetical protein BW721_05885 [Jeotgalibaca sp. PTS2502]